MARKRNAPLRGAQQIGSNMTEVEHGDLTILYSYKTPVAFLAPQGGYVTEHRWSVTTSKHIAKFFDRHGYDRKGAHKLPQEDLESIVSAGALRDFPINLDPTPAEQAEAVRRLTRRRGNPRAYVTGDFGDAEDYGARIAEDVEAPQQDDFAPYDHPGKFEGEPLIVLRLYEMSLMGGDEELGEVDCFGWYCLLTDVKTSDGVLHFIVTEDNNGFYGIHESATDKKIIEDIWNDLQDEYEKSGCADGED